MALTDTTFYRGTHYILKNFFLKRLLVLEDNGPPPSITRILSCKAPWRISTVEKPQT